MTQLENGRARLKPRATWALGHYVTPLRHTSCANCYNACHTYVPQPETPIPPHLTRVRTDAQACPALCLGVHTHTPQMHSDMNTHLINRLTKTHMYVPASRCPHRAHTKHRSAALNTQALSHAHKHSHPGTWARTHPSAQMVAAPVHVH